MAKRHPNWRGCSNIDMVYYNDTADPDLVAEIGGEEYIFNYFDIEDALWSMFLEDEGISESDTYAPGTYNIADEWEQRFDEYCQSNAYDYLGDVLFGGYFAEGSHNWHDNYN